MEVIKAISKVYSGVTLPIYYPFARDSSIESKKHVKKAVLLDENTWIRASDQLDNTPEYESLAHFREGINEIYSNKRAYGYRKILQKEKDSEGRPRLKLENEYTWISHKQLTDRINQLAMGLFAINIKPKDRVCIFMETRIEWQLFAEALFRLNATIGTLYATLGEEGIIHGINELECTHILTSNELMPKLSKLKHRLPLIQTIIVVRDVVNGEHDKFSVPKIDGCNIVPFEELENSSRKNGNLNDIPMPTAEDVAVIMYTSGSTGTPKGVILKHKNFTSALRNLAFTFVKSKYSKDATYMSYLPLAHIFELQASRMFLSLGLAVGFATPHTLLSTSPGLISGTIADVNILKPEVMAAVPLMLDRVRKAVEEKFVKKGSFAKNMFEFAMDYKTTWNQSGYQTPLIDLLITRKIKQLFGGKLRIILAGGAKISPDTHVFTKNALGVYVQIIYAATETTGGGTMMDYDDTNIGTVGPPQFGSIIKLVDWEEGGYRVTDQPNPRGEIWIKSASISCGYYKREELTKETFVLDDDGRYWFKTGDIGEMLSDGSLAIIDRKADLIKLQFGEFISPSKIEAELKCCPIVENICVIADVNHNFTIAIVSPSLVALQQLSQSSSTLEVLCADDKINQLALNEIQAFGKKGKLLKYEIPDKIKLVSDAWTPDSKLVTPTLKIQRKSIKEYYKKTIEQLFT